ncbi:hypothetical protein B0H13DRAFT_2287612, partial [Mycena leptocephala]
CFFLPTTTTLAPRSLPRFLSPSLPHPSTSEVTLQYSNLPGSDLFPLRLLNTWRSFIKYSCYLLAGTTQVSRDPKLQGYLKLQDASWLKPTSTHFTLVSQTTLRQSQQYFGDGGVGFGITVIALKICDRVSSPPLPSIAALAVTSLVASRRPDAVCLGHLLHNVPRHLSIWARQPVWYACGRCSKPQHWGRPQTSVVHCRTSFELERTLES